LKKIPIKSLLILFKKAQLWFKRHHERI